MTATPSTVTAPARGFGSDNHASVHPEVMAAIAAADGGHAPAYGDDPWTERLREVTRDVFGAAAQIFPVFNGTGANVVALQAVAPRWGGVVCSDVAHIHVDECGAPEKLGGLKLLPVHAPDGRLTPELVATQAHGFGDPHHIQPAAVSLTQASELGTVYAPAAVRALADQAHGAGMAVHVDGARISNAAAAVGCSLGDISGAVGVDVLSLGGSKNGLLLGEAVVVLSPDRVDGVEYLRKSSTQLASKMRYVSAQLLALLEGDLWRRNATHANACARALAEGVSAVGLVPTYAVEANAVFVSLPRTLVPALQQDYRFYVWSDDRSDTSGERVVVRWMCSWDTTEEDVAGLLLAVERALAG